MGFADSLGRKTCNLSKFRSQKTVIYRSEKPAGTKNKKKCRQVVGDILSFAIDLRTIGFQTPLLDFHQLQFDDDRRISRHLLVDGDVAEALR